MLYKRIVWNNELICPITPTKSEGSRLTCMTCMNTGIVYDLGIIH